MNKLIIVNKNVFSLKHSNYKQLLIDFEVLLIHSDIHIQGYVLNKKYKSFFEKLYTIVNTNRRNISVEEFKQSLERNERYGMEAEEFVFNFELKRLNQVKEIEWISRYIVNAGYDIASYNHENDSNHNRFIEVKSYSGGNLSFYWSKNELKESKRRLSNYWIYLVDRTKILEEDYEPIMINNPFYKIFQNENWSKSIENYKIQQV